VSAGPALALGAILRLAHRRQAASGARRSRRAASIVGYILGVALLGAAVWMVARQEGTLREAWDAARHAPAHLLAMLLVLPALNWIVVSLSIWLITGHFGPVGRREMLALVGSAWLLNYLPMKPGMVGRAAYHNRVNGIALSDIARAMVICVGSSGVAMVMMIVASVPLAMEWGGGVGVWIGLSIVALPAPACIVMSLRSRSGSMLSRFWMGMSLRYADMLIWAARYWVVFAVVGAPIGPDRAVVFAAISNLALLVPVLSNGMGLREWSIGLASGDPIGLAADLVNRAAELAVSVPIGLIGSADVARRLRRHAKRARESREAVGQAPA
jgi:hypothetical protein